ncbi:putative cation channel protein [Leptomonas pyrrhocoris]|uniref:Putative cation channel protein n=1 Tax=Leptomonas pyrrhocoris TaxID=157538 RepID=A0A0M9G1Z5_LEPPY|nr:putative cation channel protein [Leptomonas pyrrhocoris]XP_015658978.1 putative cation channel protein [Leptomonas pyrrhocoris]KPA80538.1 putative cation channel protein [Leptomonas pyrrhocoris]KPA80539.1 putative cation channel protein [Leptomonas pyrrhocoris]|eukprot:XP_015658977.1 putative cation channel protein [Leptomonas pyrrhocoris]
MSQPASHSLHNAAKAPAGSSLTSASAPPSFTGRCTQDETGEAAADPTSSTTTASPHSTVAHRLRKAAASSAASTASPPFLRSYRLHYDFVENALESKANALDRGTYFFFYLIFVIGFCFYFLYDVDVSARYQLRHSLLDTLAQAEMPRLKETVSFSQVASASDYGEYVLYAVAPLLANVLSPTGSSIPLGAMRLRTQRSVTIGCDSFQAGRAAALYTLITCQDGAVSAQEDTGLLSETRFDMETLWDYHSCTEAGGNRYVLLQGSLGTYHCGGFIFDAPLWVARDNASLAGQEAPPSLGTAEQAFPFSEGTLPYHRISLQRLQGKYLHQLFSEAAAPFLDNYATRMVVTEVLFYNPPLQRFATVKLVGEVTSRGSWRTSSFLRTARVWTSDDVGKGVYDAVVMLAALAWLIAFIARAVAFVQRRVAERKGNGIVAAGKRVRDTTGLSYSAVSMVRIMATAEYVFDPQNLSAVAILSLCVVTAGYRIASIVYCARAVPALDEIIYLDSYPMQLEYLFYLERVQMYVNAVLVLLLFYRGLCFVAVDTHAARVVHVLARSQSALCGYLLLSLLTTTAYALTLTTLYGDSIWSFRSVDSAFYNLFRVMVRQHDIGAFTRDDDNPLPLAFILYSYYIIGVLTTFSLAAGILVHSFTELRKEEPSPVIAAYQIQWLLHRVGTCLPRPQQWPWFGWRWCTGYGDAALLRHAARCLRCYRAAKYPALDHVEGEQRQLLDLDEFTEAMQHFSDAPSSPLHASKLRSDWRRGTWMTWATRSTSGDSSLPPSAPGDSSGSNVGDARCEQRGWTSASQDSAFLSPHASLDGHSSESLELVKSKLFAGEWERLRRQWQRRWAAYAPVEVWRDVYKDWLASTTAEASLLYREEIVWLRNGVQSAVGDNLLHAKRFSQRLAELERKLKLLESEFRENELTAAASDKVDRDERLESVQ